MKVIDALLDTLHTQTPVHDLRVCLRAAAVRTRRLGLASILPRLDHRCATEEPRPKRLSDMSAGELSHLAHSADQVEASVGLAAINSLLEPDESRLSDGKALELIRRHGAGANVVVVGHFPFVDRLRGEVNRLDVLELSPAPEDLPASEAPRVIPEADLVAMTGTTLINHTFEGLMSLARGKRVILLGPSTPLSPVLFDYGVSAICGSLVVDPEAALRSVSDGLGFRNIEGLRPVNWIR
ncbi:MAG: Rossmann-like domain-containing protein [Planctomycetota bacterium]|jgi:uncharacterized protein (DUF4213/DUF364 family)